VLRRVPDLTLPVRLQVVALLRDALAAAGLDLYLVPYGVLPTDYECGVIEVGPLLCGAGARRLAASCAGARMVK